MWSGPLERPQLHGLHPQFVLYPAQYVVLADLVDLQPIRRFDEAQSLPFGIEDGPERAAPIVARELVFLHPEMAGGVTQDRGKRGEGRGHGRGCELPARPLHDGLGDVRSERSEQCTFAVP